MGSVGFQALQLDELRACLRKMNDEELLRFGRAAASLCRPEDQFGQPPRALAVAAPGTRRVSVPLNCPKVTAAV
jgi:hypothetical protein